MLELCSWLLNPNQPFAKGVIGYQLLFLFQLTQIHMEPQVFATESEKL